MSRAGRITLPASTRRALGLEGEVTFEVEVVDGTITLRPAEESSVEDAWAYQPAHLEALRRALADSEAGRVRRMSEDDLRGLAPAE